MFIVVLDVDDRNDSPVGLQLEHDLGERRKELRALYELNQALLTPGFNAQQICQSVVRLLEPAWQYSDATVVRVTLGNVAAESKGFVVTEWMQQADVLVNQVARGSIQVGYTTAKPSASANEGPFLTEERALIQAVADRVGLWLQRTEAELNADQRGSWLSHLLSSAPLVFFTFTSEGIFTASEGKGLAALGLAPGEVVGQSIFDLYAGDASVIDAVTRSLAGEDVVAVAATTGRIYQTRFTPEFDGEKHVTHVMGVAVDVTELQSSTDQLQASESKYRALASANPDMMFIMDRNGICIDYVPAPGLSPGLDPSEFIGKPLDEFVRTELGRQAKGAISEVFASSIPTTVEYEGENPRGSGRFSNYEARIVPNPPDRVLVLVRDVTSRVAADRLLKLVEGALDAAMDAVVITDPSGTIQWVNDAFESLTGWSADEAIGKNPRDLFKSGRHGDAFYKELWNTIKSGKVWHGRIVNNRKDGSSYFEEESITPVMDMAGQITQFIAIKRDVTSLHELELAAEEINSRYTAVADAIDDGLIVANAQGAIVSVNRAAANMFRYLPSELIGQPLALLMPNRYIARHDEAFAAAIANGPRLRGQLLEVDGKRKDGSEFAAALTVTQLKNDRSGMFAGVIRDVSEQRKSREALEARAREIEGLNGLAQLQIKEQSAVFAKLTNLVSQLADASVTMDQLAATANSDTATSASVHLAHVIHQLDILIDSATRSSA